LGDEEELMRVIMVGGGIDAKPIVSVYRKKMLAEEY
jgi:hypothetical protein